jgi:hypothetical protein
MPPTVRVGSQQRGAGQDTAWYRDEHRAATGRPTGDGYSWKPPLLKLEPGGWYQGSAAYGCAHDRPIV